MPRLLLTMLVLVTIPAHSFASNINDAGANKLKQVFQDILDYEEVVTNGMGGIELIYNGEITVEQHADYYAITLPEIVIQEEGSISPETAMTIDRIAINAMPGEKEGLWKTTLTIPSTYKTAGEKSFEVNIGKQNIVAILDDRLGYFTKINMNVSEVEFKENGEIVEDFTFGGAQLYMNMDEKEEGRYSGPTHFKVTDIHIKSRSKHDKKTYKLGEFRFDINMQDVVFPTLKEYEEKVSKHLGTLNKMGNAAEEGAEEIDQNAVISMFTDLYSFDMNGMSFSYNIENFQALGNAYDAHREFDTAGLKSATLGFGFEGLMQEKGTLNIKFAYDGFNVEPIEEFRATTMPKDATFDINAINIPYKSLINIGQTTLASISEDPENAQMAGLGIMMRLPALLAQAQTQIKVENNGIKNDTYSVDLNGAVMTDLESMTGFSARFTSVFKGLDALHAVVDKETDRAEPKDGHQWYGLFEFLSTLKSIGTPTDAEDGSKSYNFNFETTPQGQMMLNGQDASTVFSK